MDIQPLDIVFHMLNIVVLFVLLRALLYKPVRKFMDDRSAAVQSRLDEAQQLCEDGEQLHKEYLNQLAHADEKADELMAEHEKHAEEVAARIVHKAEEEAAERVRQSTEHIRQKEREAVVRQQVQIADMAVALAGKLLQREVRPEDQQAAIDAFFSEESKAQ